MQNWSEVTEVFVNVWMLYVMSYEFNKSSITNCEILFLPRI